MSELVSNYLFIIGLWIVVVEGLATERRESRILRKNLTRLAVGAPDALEGDLSNGG